MEDQGFYFGSSPLLLPGVCGAARDRPPLVTLRELVAKLAKAVALGQRPHPAHPRAEPRVLCFDYLQLLQELRDTPPLGEVRKTREHLRGRRDAGRGLLNGLGHDARGADPGEAQAARIPITVYRPKDPAAQDYYSLAREVKDGA